MAHSIPVPVKPFAAAANPSGVPQDSLTSIVGELQERRVHTLSTSAALAAGEAHIVNYHPFAGDREIRVKVIQSDNTVFLDGLVNTALWYGIVIAEDGDTLVQDGSHRQTALRLTNPDSLTATAIVGRTAGNLLLIQPSVAIPSGATIEIWANEWVGGAIAERIGRIVSQPPKELRYIQRSPTEPAAPPVTAVYTGAVLVGAGAWIEDGADIPGSDTEWLAIATATYNQLAGRWIVGPWTVTSNAGGTNVQYSADETSWHNTRQGGDQYRRWRDSQGNWHYDDLVNHDENWQRILAVTYSGASSDYGITERYIAGTDLDEWKWLMWEWVYGSGLTSHVVVPSVAISVANHDADMADGNTRVLRFRRSNNGASSDDPDQGNTDGSAAHTAVFRWQLRRLAAQQASSRVASQARFDPATDSLSGSIRLYRGR